MIRNQRGNIAMAFLLGIAILMGALSLGGFMQSYLIPLRHARSKSNFMAETTILSSLIKSCLPRLNSPCAPAASWQSMADTDQAKPPSALITKTQIDAILPSIVPGMSTFEHLLDYSIVLSRDSADLDLGMGVINVTAQLTAKPKDITMAGFTDTRTYRLQVLSLGHFSLFLRPSNGSQITLGTGTSLSVYGQSHVQVNGQTLDVSKVTSASGDLYFENLSSNASRLSATSISAMKPVAEQKLNIRLEVLDDIVDPFSGMGAQVWSQQTDYFHVYSTTNRFPLPIVPGAAVYGHGPQLPAVIANSGRASDTVYPTANNIGAGNSLEETCERADDYMGFMRPLVLTRSTENLTFDFTTGGAKYFCALISASTVTIILNPGEQHVMYGHINAEKINIVGGGQLVLIDPQGMRETIASVPLPAGFSPGEVSRQMVTLSATSANNFFVPFYRSDGGTTPIAKSRYHEMKDFFEDCGADTSGNQYRCWVSYKDPIDYKQVQLESKAMKADFKFYNFALEPSEGL